MYYDAIPATTSVNLSLGLSNPFSGSSEATSFVPTLMGLHLLSVSAVPELMNPLHRMPRPSATPRRVATAFPWSSLLQTNSLRSPSASPSIFRLQPSSLIFPRSIFPLKLVPLPIPRQNPCLVSCCSIYPVSSMQPRSLIPPCWEASRP